MRGVSSTPSGTVARRCWMVTACLEGWTSLGRRRRCLLVKRIFRKVHHFSGLRRNTSNSPLSAALLRLVPPPALPLSSLKTSPRPLSTRWPELIGYIALQTRPNRSQLSFKTKLPHWRKADKPNAQLSFSQLWWLSSRPLLNLLMAVT